MRPVSAFIIVAVLVLSGCSPAPAGTPLNDVTTLPVASPTPTSTTATPSATVEPSQVAPAPTETPSSTPSKAPSTPSAKATPKPTKSTNPPAKVTTKDVTIKYKTVTRNDATLDWGKTKTIQAGKNGLRRDTYTNGKKTSSQVIREPVDKIVAKGTKTVVTTKDVTIKFKTVTRNDPSLEKGKTKTIQAGKNGLRRDTYTNGKKTSSQVIREPVDKIVAKGTKAPAPKPKQKPSITSKVCSPNGSKLQIVVEVSDPANVGYTLHMKVGGGSKTWANEMGSQPFTYITPPRGGSLSTCEAWLS